MYNLSQSRRIHVETLQQYNRLPLWENLKIDAALSTGEIKLGTCRHSESLRREIYSCYQ